MIFDKIQLIKIPSIIFIVIICFWLFNSCSDDDPAGPQNPEIVDISISPDNATIAVGEQLDFSVVALTATGDTIDTADLDIEWQWWSTDTYIFTVEPGGLATGQNPGDAYCMVEANINITHHATEIPDKLIVETGLLTDGQNRHQAKNLSLSAEERDFTVEIENISTKNMLRFTGRDSAFVMVF